MHHQFHASDSDCDEPDGLEFGNVQLLQPASQLHQDQPAHGVGPRLPLSATDGQQLVSPDISSLPDWDPHPVAHTADGRAAAASCTRAEQQPACCAAAGHAQGARAAQRPHSAPPDRGFRSHTAADRLLSHQSHYLRKNAATPPPLPAPPPWLSGRLGGGSLTELYLQDGARAHARHVPPAAPPHVRMQPAAQRLVPTGNMHAAGAAAAPLPAGLRPSADQGSIVSTAAAAVAQAAAQQQHANGGSVPGASAQAAPTPLHHELLRFAAQAVPTNVEAAAVGQGLAAIRAAAQRVWPQSTATLFGSQATGLALPGADLDVVVLGANVVLQNPASGYSQEARHAISGLLEDLADALQAAQPPVLLGNKRPVVVKAKVPIVKCTLAAGGGIPADISLGTANGVGAAQYINCQLGVLPVLRPLILAVKAYLREKGLNEVFSGGLSSYTLASMCMAHLQAEGLAAAVPAASAANAASGSAHPAVDLQAMPLAAASPSLMDAGRLLHGFFARFGYAFRYDMEAVSVRRGGIVGKLPQWRVVRKKWLLAVEDPQERDKDIAQGSYSIRQAKNAFRAAAVKLQAGVSAAVPSLADAEAQAEAAAWARVQADGQSRSSPSPSNFPILRSLFDVDLVLSRDGTAAKKRAAAAAAATRKVRLDARKVSTRGKRKAGLAPDRQLPDMLLAPRGGKFKGVRRRQQLTAEDLPAGERPVAADKRRKKQKQKQQKQDRKQQQRGQHSQKKKVQRQGQLGQRGGGVQKGGARRA